MRKCVLAVAASLLTAGCVSIPDVNESFRRIDRVWALEYQRNEDALRARVVDAEYVQVFEAVRAAFLALGLPLDVQDIKAGRLVASGNAPVPLTQEEWAAVVKEEALRVKQIGGWYMVLNEQGAKDYVVTIAVKVTPLPNRTVVVLDYEMDSPKLRSLGVMPSKNAPPMAVQIATHRFWMTLETELAKARAPAPRQRRSGERDA